MTKRELERLYEDFERGVYVKKSTTILLVVLTLCLGLFLGNLLTVIYSSQPQTPRTVATAPNAASLFLPSHRFHRPWLPRSLNLSALPEPTLKM